MIVFVQQKSLGSKQEKILKKEVDIPLPSTLNLRTFLSHFVQYELNAFNQRLADSLLLNSLEQIETKGKVSFGDRINSNSISEAEAIDIVLQAFEDGLFALFHNDDPLEDLDESLNPKEHDVFSFIKLTFLSGSIW